MADDTKKDDAPKSQDTKTDDSKPAEGAAGAAAGAANGQAPQLSILTQYIKDLSFESPGAPMSLQPRQKPPAINININVNANPISETDFDVTLTLNATANDPDDQKVLFNVELVYGGVFRVAGFPQEQRLAVVFIECPRILFPFARHIVADCTRNGGFPPLMIDPVDFARMFQRRLAEEQAKQKVAAGQPSTGTA